MNLNTNPNSEATNKGITHTTENCKWQNVRSHIKYTWYLYFVLLAIQFFILSLMMAK
jgi:hypothetical protein